jgi:hypothetical protein
MDRISPWALSDNDSGWDELIDEALQKHLPLDPSAHRVDRTSGYRPLVGSGSGSSFDEGDGSQQFRRIENKPPISAGPFSF